MGAIAGPINVLLKPMLKSLYWRAKTVRQDWLFGRVACMGLDVFTLLNSPWPLLNVQKGRIDYLLDVATAPRLKARPSMIAPFIQRQDIVSLITQEGDLTWLNLRPPLAIYMDSFSELTDQLFVHRRERWRFCAHYSDVEHSLAFENQFEALGLLSVADLQAHYQKFFTKVRQWWGEIPIIFLHFPVTLDKREKFQMRSSHILESITQVAKEFPPFFSLTVDDSIVGWPEVKLLGLEDFPYHFNQRTYQIFSEQVRATGIFEMLKIR